MALLLKLKRALYRASLPSPILGLWAPGKTPAPTPFSPWVQYPDRLATPALDT